MAVAALPSGESTAPITESGLPPPTDEAIRQDSVRLVYRQTSAGLIGHFLGWVVCTLVYWEHVPHHILWGWSLAFGVLWTGRFANLLSYERAALQGRVEPARWLRMWNTGAIIGAALWSVAGLLFYAHGGAFERAFLMLTIYSFAIGAVPYMASQTPLFLTCMGLYFVPMILRTALNGGEHDLKMAGIWCLLCLCTLALGRAFRNMFGEMVSLRSHAQNLAKKLHGEMKAAEAAQRDAETANRAKTQFFAAASHDLRQPLHALGLFAEALRSRSKDEGVAQLVNSINSSVDALEGLFSELLDITKIDTGGVDIEPEHFAMHDLFTRIRLHFEPTAFEKGLMLSFHGEQHFAYADPLVVERILRNLISNAIRYTEDGGVLVSCRRRGDQLLLQVWDTGIGIAEKEQGRIFEEFYQTQSNRPLEPHHRKGLGLGLAIVKRLAGLMDTDLTLRSRVGHGTVFSCLLPIGRAPRLQPVAPTSKSSLGVTLDRRHIVVVEDEVAVLEGLQVLLKGWGATVSAFDSVRSVEEWLARTSGDKDLPRPDLIMVDYRLPEQLTGIDAIKKLRERFGQDLPAILVTGSTMTQHEEEARQHNFHVLLKPVVPTKLRAMIAFKLSLR
ncbi:ATP-binding response regulator [Aquabacterium parvum]|jgi:signal transduction histidine kinase/CheY-like chemotaxis protein|uniref:ATP-binding response regulator n=1 Tax=Aquabacterium parvum TaxID=70584 RepID=UPI0009FAA033|nr:ATP-binding protein [Aquabacterium parvum]MBU0918305.1 hybrid sensor histidine kinase/response regulator [Gammaproteobacteria bacterium]